MVMEILHESQEWRVELPNEDIYRGRLLEARDEARVCDQWVYIEGDWQSNGPEGKFSYWSEIVSLCLYRGWTLVSLPPETGDGR
jgi:hypothetical protein